MLVLGGNHLCHHTFGGMPTFHSRFMYLSHLSPRLLGLVQFNHSVDKRRGLRCDKIWFTMEGQEQLPIELPHTSFSTHQQPWWASALSKTNRRCLLTTPTGYTVAIRPLQSIVQCQRNGSSKAIGDKMSSE